MAYTMAYTMAYPTFCRYPLCSTTSLSSAIELVTNVIQKTGPSALYIASTRSSELLLLLCMIVRYRSVIELLSGSVVIKFEIELNPSIACDCYRK